MIRPFGLRDLPLVYKLQHNGVWLDLFSHLLVGRSALALALLSPVPWVGAGLADYVWQTRGRPQAFVQMLRRAGRQEADLLFMAPAVAAAGSANRQLWEQFLGACAEQAAAQNLRRLLAGTPQGAAEADLLAGLGWMLYTAEEIWVLPRTAAPRALHPAVGLRPREAKDVWWLRRLYSLYTPQPVQHAEGIPTGDDQTQLPLAWWEMTHESSFVVENKAEVIGGVQVITGRRGHWLIVHGDPNNAGLMTDLLHFGVQAAGRSHRPILCAVRPYQSGLNRALQDSGFNLMAERSRMVKHLAVRVKVAEPLALPALVPEG